MTAAGWICALATLIVGAAGGYAVGLWQGRKGRTEAVTKQSAAEEQKAVVDAEHAHADVDKKATEARAVVNSDAPADQVIDQLEKLKP